MNLRAAARTDVVALASGALFGIGLVVSGMTDPRKVLGFLDVTGSWDPSLLFVMAGAVGVHALAYRWSLRRTRPLFAAQFQVPTKRALDSNLVVGAGLFGVGWGLSGYCPGPALVSLARVSPGVVIFVLAMLVGTYVSAKVLARADRKLRG